MRNAEAERFVRDVWAAFQREGIAGVLPLAAADAQWHPHSARRRRFASTAEYREQLERVTDERVDANATGMWSHGAIVLVRGRMRIHKGAELVEDTRMYWLFEVHAEQLTRVASSPDLAGLLREAGHGDAVLAREAFIALHRDAGLD